MSFDIIRYGQPDANTLLFQMVDDHDLEVIEQEVSHIRELFGGQDFCLTAVKINDWNQDLSPWPAPADRTCIEGAVLNVASKKKKKQLKNEAVYIDPYPDMDGDFAFIAGYTSGGAPYGMRWEDVGIDSELPFEEKVRLYMDQINDQKDVLPPDDGEELPFD